MTLKITRVGGKMCDIDYKVYKQQTVTIPKRQIEWWEYRVQECLKYLEVARKSSNRFITDKFNYNADMQIGNLSLELRRMLEEGEK